MDGWIALGILALLALPVLAVAAFVMALGARHRLATIERRLAELESRGVAPIAAAAPPEATIEEPEPAALAEAAPASAAEIAVPEAPEQRAKPKRPRESLEQKLGARWAVWVGGLALALGAIFLVRYSIEAGLLGPGVRIAGAALFSLALLGVGEWLRRSNRVTAFSAIPSANIPGILTAAGTVGLFATAYGAYALYGLIGPTAAFILLALIGLGTMAAAALHGPWLSGLGLVGSYAAPLLVATTDPNMAILIVYLAFVTISAYGLARLRQWRWLAIAASVGAVGWGFLMLGSPSGALSDAIYAVMILALAALFLVIDVHGAEDRGGDPDRLASGVLAAIALLLLAGAGASGFETASIVAAMIGGAMLLVIALRYDAVALAAPTAAALLLGLLFFWPAARQAAAEPTGYVVDAVTAYFPIPDAIAFFGGIAASGAAALIAAALAQLQLRAEPRPWVLIAHAGAATVGPLLAAAFAYLRISGFASSIGFAAVTLSLGALYAVLAERFMRRERPGEALDMLPTGIFAAGAVAALAFALSMALERGILTTALALASFGTAWVQTKRPIAALRYAVTAMAVLVLARIFWDPYIFSVHSGPGVYGSIALGYGIPFAAFAGAAILLHRVRTDRAAYAAEAVSIVTLALLFAFEIHAVTFGGNLLEPATALSEQGLATTVAFAFSLGLSRLGRRQSSPVMLAGALVARLYGLANAVLSLGLFLNPILTGDPVRGGWLWNEVMLAYALPALLAGFVAAQPLAPGAGKFKRMVRLATGIVAFALAFGAISLEIRFLYAATPDLSAGVIGQAESYTYSAAWLIFGLVLLLVGLVFDVKADRIGSAVLILITVLKVFLIDMANLEGVWRALSFMGLGVVLIGIGLLYQRLLFGGREPPSDDLPPAAREAAG